LPLSVADVSVPAAAAMLAFELAAAVDKIARVAVKFASVETAVAAAAELAVAVEAFTASVDCTATRSLTALPEVPRAATVRVEVNALVADVLAVIETNSDADAVDAAVVAEDAAATALVYCPLRSATLAFAVASAAEVVATTVAFDATAEVAVDKAACAAVKVDCAADTPEFVARAAVNAD
jgi:hypothetical protein